MSKSSAVGFHPASKSKALCMANGGSLQREDNKPTMAMPMGRMQDSAANQQAATGFRARQTTGQSTVLPGVDMPMSTDMPRHPDADPAMMEKERKAAGLKNGGDLKPGQSGTVPGTGKGDKIDAKYEPGEFIVSNAMLAADPSLRAELEALRAKVLATKGMTPEQADEQAMAGTELRAARGYSSDDEQKRLAAMQQIPTSGPAAPAPDGRSDTSLSRNVNNGINALGGMGVVSAVPLGFGRAAQGTALANPATLPAVRTIQTLPAANAALQQGAQANALAGAGRSLGNANAALVSGERSQPAPALAPAMAAAPAAMPTPAAPRQSGATGSWDAPAPVGFGAAAASTPAPAGAAPEQPSEYGRQMGAVGGSLVNGLKTLVSAPGYGFNSPDAAPAPVTPAAATPAPAAQTAQQRAAIAPAASTVPTAPTAAAPVIDPAAATGNVTRVGNSYSGSNVAGNVSINNQPTGFGGAVSAQNNAAAEALAARSQERDALAGPGAAPTGFSPPVTLSSANDWQKRNDLRNLEVSASSTTAQGDRRGASAEQVAYQTALAQDTQARYGADAGSVNNATQAAALQRTGMTEAGATQRAGIQQQGVKEKNQIDREELGMKQTAAGFTARSAKRIEDLQTAYEAAKPEDKPAIAEQLRVLGGKDKAANWKTSVLQGQKNADGSTTESVMVATNEQTGEIKRLDQPAAARNISTDPKALAIKNNTKLSLADKQKQLQALGY